MHFLHILAGGKMILITGGEQSYNTSEFWPAISRREHKYLNRCSRTKASIFSFVPGVVSEGHMSECKTTDSLVLGTVLIPAQVNQWFHMLAFTLVGPACNFI